VNRADRADRAGVPFVLCQPETHLIPLAIGFLIGFIGSIPPTGPTSVLVLHRALKGRRLTALAVGAGAALPEAAYAALALWGIGHLVLWHPWVKWVGPAMALLVVMLFARALVKKRLRRDRRAPAKWNGLLRLRRGLARPFLLGFSTALVNATLLFTWSAVASFIHQWPRLRAHLDPLWLVPVGVFAGIVAWFAVAVVLADRWSARHVAEAPEREVTRG
jgi:threonine/homoserine/homoserine lactone efflux protein